MSDMTLDKNTADIKKLDADGISGLDHAVDLNQTTASMMQIPAEWAELGESPLAHADWQQVAKQNKQSAGVELEELALLGHILLRADARNESVSAAIQSVLAVNLPPTLMSETQGEVSISWLAPDEWLIVCPLQNAFLIEQALREKITGHYSLVNVSGGQTILALSGENALDVLKKSTPYDVHERNFPINKAVSTVFAKSQVMLRRTGEQQWQMVIRRSFADYIWLWLQESSREYGLSVKTR